MKYLLGLDGGTQSSKVTIFDEKGKEICNHVVKLKPMYKPKIGVALHPDDDLWDSLVLAIKGALSKFPHDVSDIAGIGLLSIRACRVLMKEDGSLSYPVISWMDERIARPYEHDVEGTRYLAATTGYVSHKFTGNFKDTAPNYHGEWPLDKSTWGWSTNPDVLDRYKLPIDMLFELVKPGDVLGYVTAKVAAETGLIEGTPVVATASDKAVEGLGSGLKDDGTLLVSLGTYITAMRYQDNIDFSYVPKNYFINLACRPDKYLTELFGLMGGMATVSWFRDFMGEEVASKARELGVSKERYLDTEAAKLPAGSEGVMTVQDLLTPARLSFRRGTIVGLNFRHGPIHVYRSILEGIAMSIKNSAHNMYNELGIEMPKKLIVSGGGSNGDIFVQIFADVFGVPAYRNEFNEAAGIGSAVAAAVGSGVYPDFDTALDNMVRIKDEFLPNMENHKIYTRLNNEVYSKLREKTDDLYKVAREIING